MPPVVWLAIDFLFVIWLFAAELIGVAFAVCTWTTWRVVVRRRQLVASEVARGIVIGGAIVASVGAVVVVAFMLPSALGLVVRPLMCETTTFDEAVSPNGRYRAAVAQVDCGAVTGFNRQVLLTRRPFWWTAQTILYFREEPTLRLSWSGRMLTINGDRTRRSMNRPPPDPILWGGVLARYSGPKE
ncbi:MAG: hypothetical protein DME07_13475 [Candidatus Rokuibacteriota bacterium]|nr:MAG: hypothetical protein DME07_13475 [Candidatus Rokubacteria bacterium]PYN56062.1 MAG: hypothetical protein DMD94_09200 [Candidatus Rokubacteria bacterium]